MGTRSSVTIEISENEYQTIYGHWDGYPSHVGKMLFENYNTEEKAKQLISLGDFSSLDESIECPENHSFDNPINGYSIFYDRDRGDKNTKARTYFSYKGAMNSMSQEFDYLFKNNKWHVFGKELKESMFE